MLKRPTAEEIRELREETGLGMMEIKRALMVENLRDAINDLPFAPVELKEILNELLNLHHSTEIRRGR